MNEQLSNYLSILRGDIYKLLPMKESEMEGTENHIIEYLNTLLINIDGAGLTYPELITRREYLWVINNLQYLKNHDLVFSRWRSTILSSVNAIDKLYRFYKGE